MFARYGVPEYWMVDPVRRQVRGARLEAGAYRLAQEARAGDTVRSALLPDLGFDAGELFTPL